MTPEQHRLARHALGLPNDTHQSYRNYFLCGTNQHGDFAAWDAMEKQGLALSIGRETSRLAFGLTHEGATAALEPGESLDPEDFPSMPIAPLEAGAG